MNAHLVLALYQLTTFEQSDSLAMGAGAEEMLDLNGPP